MTFFGSCLLAGSPLVPETTAALAATVAAVAGIVTQVRSSSIAFLTRASNETEMQLLSAQQMHAESGALALVHMRPADMDHVVMDHSLCNTYSEEPVCRHCAHPSCIWCIDFVFLDCPIVS